MKTLGWTCFLLIGILACSKSDPDPALTGNTRAQLNGQAWGGTANAWRSQSQNEPCVANTFNLAIKSSLPYPKGARLQETALCANCGTQSLGFAGIPLAVGSYPVSVIQSCQVSNQVGVSYITLVGGDVIRDYYQPKPTNVGFITITNYDSRVGRIEGTFDLTLVRDVSRGNPSDAPETVRFRNGAFKINL